ncbi:Na-translocating system protein MpsC family protein [Paenibacillus flagellatus]|uniref:Na+-translocating membrane potential-generating system MpsC domain-containing protein n=1 Tax=Paenibacillus flagellatus TaxID=2211139 RepID=A0A2V5JX82_9BACL|nr:Na-translocating system protein MpsC family protein [Paenibacillus flagellatus]PYI51388.1 hypothetical protein DLM86_25555 [Paenibacillus flagellatus]
MKESKQAQQPPAPSQPLQHMQQTIGSYVGKRLRDTFGKGPESVFVSIGHTYIAIYLRNFMAPPERVLLEQKQEAIVRRMRDYLMKPLLPDVADYIGTVAGIRPNEAFYDWELSNRSGMIVFGCGDPIADSPPPDGDYPGKEEVERELASAGVHPLIDRDGVRSFEINPRTIVAIRHGILLPIERELLRLGHGESLKELKRSIEKQRPDRRMAFESALRRTVVDLFVDWDFERDKGVFVFVLSPKPPR